MSSVSRKEVAYVAIVSSVVSIAVMSWLRKRLESKRCSGTAMKDDDDFHAGQVRPTSKDQSHVPYHHERLTLAQVRCRSQKLLKLCQQRRTIRFFAKDPVPTDVISNILQTACTAPSGAHRQPLAFAAVGSMALKQKISELVEKEETLNYERRMRKSWVADVASMVSQVHDTGKVQKPYLTEAPWLVLVFKQTHSLSGEGERLDNYYVQESVGIACGMLCVAVQNANLVTLTSTPMGAEKGIRDLLGRPENEKLFLLMPIVFPAADATVPYRDPERKSSSETIVWKT
jgi:iodotyrosine deiodinase